mgnify:CR=1 FL=1
MTIESNNRSGELVPSDEVTSLIQYSLGQLGLHADCEVSLTFVDEAEMTELHIKWMDEPGPTDVLSFPMDELRPGTPEDMTPAGLLGDIVVCPTVAERQAVTAGHETTNENLLLTTHAILHLLGFDHAEPDEEKEMFGLQREILESFYVAERG